MLQTHLAPLRVFRRHGNCSALLALLLPPSPSLPKSMHARMHARAATSEVMSMIPGVNVEGFRGVSSKCIMTSTQMHTMTMMPQGSLRGVQASPAPCHSK